MINILGYQITEELYESANTLVYRGQRSVDNQPVILKVLKQDYPPPEKIAGFKREYEITCNLNIAGVVDAYSLESDQHRWVMALEDFGGESLARLELASKFPLTEFLTLAIQVTDILGQIHQQNIMHKDINPSNIVFNPTTGQVKVIDFGISTALARESTTIHNPDMLEGTLAYISPEQTGRMNRAMDYRTDFYSLGATFYEVLTGQLPFCTTGTMELVHCHLAKQPTSPSRLKADIPQPVSDIVLKLLAKDAEDRYQSAHGLRTDLEACLRQWQTTGSIIHVPIGQHDVSDRFQIPQKLYGREAEIAKLLAASERVSQGASEMMLVSGYAGIGKTALVQEIYKPITRQQGYFISGKFDQFQRNTPYSSLIQAFRSLMQQLLTESKAQIDAWREKLLTALGSNGQVIIEVIPEAELIIGPQPAVPELPPNKAQNRFNLVFQNFIRVFTKPEHPLVIFLDDLQWADTASLNLIKPLMTSPDSQYLFLIGAYRNNEVGPAHPLMLTLDEIQKAETIVNHISLSPLDFSSVNQLIVDTLNCAPEKTSPLAELVLEKTGGNPFFMIEFLKSLYAENLLVFDFQHGGWQWDLTDIQALNITDNVVELMAGKVRKLRSRTQQVLKLATCIGNQFNLQTLATIYEKSPRETASDLWEAVAQGLVLPLADAYKVIELDVPNLADEVTVDYKFFHDRIQQAAYSLIPSEDKQAVHRRVGQLLLRNTPPDEREEKIFDIVNQLNLGTELIDRQSERDELAELNLIAGRKAKASAAYEPAFNYFKSGISLLGEDNWKGKYNLTLALYVEAAEVAYLNTDFEQMEIFAQVVLHQARTLLDKVKIYEVKIQAYTAQNKLPEAVKTALTVLKLLGVRFPEKPNKLNILLGLIRTKIALIGKRIEDLINLPEMTDPYKLAAARILVCVGSAAYLTIPELFPLLVFKTVNLLVKHGNASVSPVAYASYGIILCGVMGDIDSGYQFGKLALRLSERFNAKELKAKTILIFCDFIQHWKEHIRETLNLLLEGYQSGLESGDIEYACYCAFVHSCHSHISGENLQRLEREMASYSGVMGQLKYKFILHLNELYRQAVLNLMGKTGNPCHLIGESYDEEKMLPIHQQANDRSGIFFLYFNKLMLCYLFQEYPQAVENAAMVEKYLDGATALPFVSLFHFYDSLAGLAMFPNVQKSEQKRLLKKVTANQKKMKKWAHHAPMNHLQRFYLVEAERASVLSQDGTAREYYDKAISLAQENGYINEEALAHELASKFYLARGQAHLSHHYLRESHYAYQQWGALAKVKDLETRYPEVFAQAKTVPLTTMSTTTEQRASSDLDLISVMKASQAISGEIVLDRLLTKLMTNVIENAGAQIGYLILEKQGQWVIEAEGAVDKADVTVLQSIPIEEQSLPMSIVNYVARTKESVVLNDATKEGTFTRDPYIVAAQPQSVLCAPLINQGRLTGMLYLENKLTTGAFTTDRLTVLNLLSSQAAISIENARLYANLESSEKKYRTLFEETKDTIFITSPEGKIIDINQAGLNLSGYTRTEMMQMNAQDLYVNPADRLRFQQEIGQKGSVRDFEVKLRGKDGTELDCLITATVRQADDGTVLGYQGIIRDITEHKQAEQEHLQLSAIQRELVIAQEIQQSLLPPNKPDQAGVDVVCHSVPAREVGGDFYTYHAFDPEGSSELLGRYALAVGDVSGKGMPAALLMAVSLASFQSVIGQALAPGELLAYLDNAIGSYTHTTHRYCTLVYAEITPPTAPLVGGGDKSGVIRVANAGCIMPIIRRVDGMVEWMEVGGMPLGMGLGAQAGYDEVSLSLSKGDLVILTSDGVVEAMTTTEEMFGFERLEQAVASGPQTNAEAMLNHLRATMEAFIGDTELYDDLTIVVAQV